jgi:hypothetical protein
VLERHKISVTQGPQNTLKISRLEPPPPVLDTFIAEAVLSREMLEWLCELTGIDISEFYAESPKMN